MKKIAILGSTGSIGTQSLDIISEYPERFNVTALTAGNNWELLARQALKYRPKLVVINSKEGYPKLKEALSGSGIETACGKDEICKAAALEETDIVVTAMVGYSGLLPTISAIKAGKTIALANKETLVVAGQLITGMIENSDSSIIPVDSEHSAIFQCLVGEDRKKMNKILLTASGGPFRTLSKEQLEKVTVRDALKHPNWDMGAKVTIDSASMMNKGFEMIEARWLFDCKPENIEVVVHPQSIIHSMVEFCDGSVKAQLGIPDMHLPIRYALGYPERLESSQRKLSVTDYATLTFEKPDLDKFPLLGYAFEAIAKGGTMPCILNAANEKAVAAFIDGKIKFTDVPRIVEYVMEKTPFSMNSDLESLVKTNEEALRISQEWLDKHSQKTI